MQSVKKLFKFYIDSSIHVALAVCTLTCITQFVFSITIAAELLGFVFLSTITGYNFVKYAGVAKLHHRSLTNNLKIIQVFSLVCFIGFLILCFFQTLQTLIIAGVLGSLTALYAIPFLPHEKNLRSIKSTKIFVIALVWAGTACWLPLENWNIIFSAEAICWFFQIYVLVLALLIPFEIRDLNYDSPELGTFPQLIGVKKTKWAGYLLLVAFMILGIFIQREFHLFIPTIAIVVVSGLFIYFSSVKQPNYYASFWVEAVPIFWLGLLWIFN